MAIAVEMPKPGNTVEECLLSRWSKQRGEHVEEGELLAEIETDKATFDVVAPAAGTLLETFVAEGALVPVFTNICVIGEPGESTDGFAPRPVARDAAGTPVHAPGSSVVSRTPLASARGSETLIPSRDRQGAVVAGQDSRGEHALSPRARRYAREHGLDPNTAVAGSGPGGRVLEHDLRRAPGDLAEPGERLSGIREKIAARLKEALATTAQYTLHGSADATGLVALRRRFKTGAFPEITIDHIVLFCAAKVLLRMPELNAEFRGGRLYRHTSVHLGFACDTGRGLLVPVIREAQALDLAQLSARARELAATAAAGTISPDELAGATFTVSNLGALGIESFTPILAPPQVALLGVNAIQPKPVRREGRIEFVDAIGLSLTCDHQVIDGAPGARFLQVVRECIEGVEQACTI